MLSLLGVENWAAKIDQQRKTPKGAAVEFLDRITDRRNRIAHQGDRQVRGCAQLTVAEVRDDLAGLDSFVQAVGAVCRR